MLEALLALLSPVISLVGGLVSPLLGLIL